MWSFKLRKALTYVIDRHLCMSMCGLKSAGCETISSSMQGVFRDDPKTREEFLRLATSTR